MLTYFHENIGAALSVAFEVILTFLGAFGTRIVNIFEGVAIDIVDIFKAMGIVFGSIFPAIGTFISKIYHGIIFGICIIFKGTTFGISTRPSVRALKYNPVPPTTTGTLFLF